MIFASSYTLLFLALLSALAVASDVQGSFSNPGLAYAAWEASQVGQPVPGKMYWITSRKTIGLKNVKGARRGINVIYIGPIGDSTKYVFVSPLFTGGSKENVVLTEAQKVGLKKAKEYLQGDQISQGDQIDITYARVLAASALRTGEVEAQMTNKAQLKEIHENMQKNFDERCAENDEELNTIRQMLQDESGGGKEQASGKGKGKA